MQKNFTNPRQTGHEIKLFFFFILDAGIVAVMVLLAFFLNIVIALPGIMAIVFYICAGLFGLFLCFRSASHPTDRNVLMIYYLLRRDRNKYHPIEPEGGRGLTL